MPHCLIPYGIWPAPLRPCLYSGSRVTSSLRIIKTSGLKKETGRKPETYQLIKRTPVLQNCHLIPLQLASRLLCYISPRRMVWRQKTTREGCVTFPWTRTEALRPAERSGRMKTRAIPYCFKVRIWRWSRCRRSPLEEKSALCVSCPSV